MKNKVNILIGFNDTEGQRAIKQAFENSKIQCKAKTYKSGNLCFQELKKSRFELAIIDINLPEMSGLKILEEMKKLESFIPVIVLVEPGDDKSFLEAMKFGANDCIYKTSNFLEVLLFKIKNVFEKRELITSSGKYRSTLSSMEDIVFVLDKDGIFKEFYQPSDRPDLYIPPDMFLENNFKDIMPKEVVKLFDNAIKKLVKSGSSEQVDYNLEMPDGMKWFCAKLTARHDGMNSFTGLTIVVREITDRKIAEIECRENEELFRAVFDNAPEAIILVEDGKIIDCNNHSLKMLKYKNKNEILQLFFPAEISPKNQPDGTKSYDEGSAIIAKALKTKKDTKFKWYLKQKKAKVIPVEINLSVLDAGNKTYLNTIIREIE